MSLCYPAMRKIFFNLCMFAMSGGCLLTAVSAFAQSNNECASALQITDPENFCSPPNAANNLFATASNVPLPPCFNTAQHDVWFWFIAEAPNAVAVVNGGSISGGGSLVSPEIAIYEGACDALTLLGCETDVNFIGVTELRVEDLTPGEKYFIRVDGEIPGTFQFCLRNFFFDGGVSGDCPTAVRLCDKKPFNVPAVAGPGTNPFEMDDATCFGGFANVETSSTWYVFTAANNGTLEFRLVPNNLDDDLDFVVYRLPNGVGDCTDKIVERCMAAGDLVSTSPCMGPTGLNAASTSIEHAPGCLFPDDNNFLKYLDCLAGSTYALAINNFTSTGNGFQLEWGGSVEFVGPQAEIATNQPDDVICLGDTIRYSDVSTVSQGIITDWGWTFGEGASQNVATTSGPHDIVYSSTGLKVVTLNIKSSLGCEVSDTRFITVDDCCPISLAVNVSAPCQSTTATATVQVQNAQAPFSYQWSNGQQDSLATGLSTGSQTVTVTDANGCMEVASFFVPALIHFTSEFPTNTSIFTGNNVTLQVVTDNPELQVSWTPQPSGLSLLGNPQTFMPLETTTYLVRAFVGDCSLTDSLTITVLDNLFEVPTAFTPNGDQMNDRFTPVLNGGTIINLSVWSRWGELVYEGNNSNGWDGTFDGEAAPSDVYVYQLVVRLPNGEEKKRHGDVTLIR